MRHAPKFSAKKSGVAARPRAGFTLIELLVAIGLFSVVVLIVSGAISSVINVNKKAQTITSIVNNLNFTLESMTRAIKTGTNLDVGGETCTNTCCDSVTLTDARNRNVTYAYLAADSAITVAVDGADPSPITAAEIKVLDLKFCDLSDSQPAVLFVVSGKMDALGGISSDFQVQSTVAQRALLLPHS